MGIKGKAKRANSVGGRVSRSTRTMTLGISWGHTHLAVSASRIIRILSQEFEGKKVVKDNQNNLPNEQK